MVDISSMSAEEIYGLLSLLDFAAIKANNEDIVKNYKGNDVSNKAE